MDKDISRWDRHRNCPQSIYVYLIIIACNHGYKYRVESVTLTHSSSLDLYLVYSEISRSPCVLHSSIYMSFFPLGAFHPLLPWHPTISARLPLVRFTLVILVHRVTLASTLVGQCLARRTQNNASSPSKCTWLLQNGQNTCRLFRVLGFVHDFD